MAPFPCDSRRECAFSCERHGTRVPHVPLPEPGLSLRRKALLSLKASSARQLLIASIFILFTPALPLRAQGCTQCLDSTRATPPQVQSAYRHAIYLLGGTALTLFVAGILLTRNRH